MFRRAKQINTPLGQLVVAAMVFDDIVALILISVLQTLNDPSAEKVIIPICAAIGFLVVGGFLALYAVPRLLTRVVIPLLPPRYLESAMLSLLTVWVRELGPGPSGRKNARRTRIVRSSMT